MLAYMPQGIDEHDHFARDVLVDSANDRDWWRVSVWIARLCRRVTDEAFAQQVRDMALSYDESIARPGLRLLPWAMRRPLDAGERLALEGRVLDAARDSGPGAGLVEPLAAVADTERLRRRLTELAMTAESPVNRYARWGLNAAIRRNGEKAPDL
jgi:hypothetical protein